MRTSTVHLIPDTEKEWLLAAQNADLAGAYAALGPAKSKSMKEVLHTLKIKEERGAFGCPSCGNKHPSLEWDKDGENARPKFSCARCTFKWKLG